MLLFPADGWDGLVLDTMRWPRSQEKRRLVLDYRISVHFLVRKQMEKVEENQEVE